MEGNVIVIIYLFVIASFSNADSGRSQKLIAINK